MKGNGQEESIIIHILALFEEYFLVVSCDDKASSPRQLGANYVNVLKELDTGGQQIPGDGVAVQTVAAAVLGVVGAGEAVVGAGETVVVAVGAVVAIFGAIVDCVVCAVVDAVVGVVCDVVASVVIIVPITASSFFSIWKDSFCS